jgi:PAS domain-containing protein
MEGMLFGILVAAILVMVGLLLSLKHVARRSETALAQARTALVAAEEPNKVATARWQAIVSGMPDGLMVLDPHLRLVEWNQHFAEFAGVPPEALREGMDLEDILRAQASSGRLTLSRRSAAVWPGINQAKASARLSGGGQTARPRNCAEVFWPMVVS